MGNKIVKHIKKYPLPGFLLGKIDPKRYAKWLDRKARTHVRRDRAKGNKRASISVYKEAIQCAVVFSIGRDAYTNELLRWDLISRYDNLKSKAIKREYKHRYALLPTVDHEGHGAKTTKFKICAWRTNDAKNDLLLSDFVKLCQMVLK